MSTRRFAQVEDGLRSTADPGSVSDDVAAIVTAMTEGERPFLRSALEAVLSDPGVGQAIVCVEERNDWVTDVLGELVTDPRLEIVRLNIAPPGKVRNRALQHVTLPWVAYCDGDDVWCNGKTRRQRSVADATDSDFVAADHCLTDERGRTAAFALARYAPMPSSWLVRTEIMSRYPFDETLAGTEDGEWWIRTAALMSRTRLPETLLRYRVRAGSISAQSASKRRKALIVAVAGIPVIRQLVIAATWLLSVVMRRHEYVWRDEWGPDPRRRTHSGYRT